MRNLAFLALTLGTGALLTGCGGSQLPTGAPRSTVQAVQNRRPPAAETPILIAFDFYSSSLIYWPIRRSGGSSAKTLSGPLGFSDGFSMAANGQVVAIASTGYSSPALYLYDIHGGTLTRLADPYGPPQFVAIDRSGNMYTLDGSPYGGVTLWKNGSWQTSHVVCGTLYAGYALGLNNEGDAFISGQIDLGSYHYKDALFEIKSGSQTCTQLNLHVKGRITGINGDPNTDDLVVIADGELIIFPKPYKARTSIHRALHQMTLATDFRFDAQSKHIFYLDHISGETIIDQAKYPSAAFEGYYSSGDPASFTTVPNSLPN